MKLRYIKSMHSNDVPDHVIEETMELCRKLRSAIYPYLKESHPNIMLAAFNLVHANVLAGLVHEDDLATATILTAESLVNNVLTILQKEEKGNNTNE